MTELRTAYGSGKAEDIASANRILDSVLPRNEAAKVDSTDKFAHTAAVDFYRLHSAIVERMPAPVCS